MLFSGTLIRPLDWATIEASVQRTSKILIVHEDTLTAGFGAEISAVIAAEAFTDLDAPIQRLATADVPIPYNIPMMEAVLPTVEKIKQLRVAEPMSMRGQAPVIWNKAEGFNVYDAFGNMWLDFSSGVVIA